MFRVALLLSLAVAAPAVATVYVPVDFREMVTASVGIVHGRVIDVRAEPAADRRSIATYVTMAVDERLKGPFGSQVTFRVPGGQVGRYRRVIVGAPQFARGDEAIVFLSARGPSLPYLFGLSQGVFRVTRLGDGRGIVSPPAIAASGTAPERIVRGDPARRPRAVEAFTREIKTILEGGR
jgi:hypothetical protein